MAKRCVYSTSNPITRKAVKVYWDSDVQEYQCRLYDHGQLKPQADYFTDDHEDALTTAGAMVRQNHRRTT